MSDITPRLGLPYLVPAQAQPEVPINEAFDILDSAVGSVTVDKQGDSPADAPNVHTIKFAGSLVSVEHETDGTALVTIDTPSDQGGEGGRSSAMTLNGTATTLDVSTASLFAIDLTANTAVTLTGAPAGKDTEVTLLITQGGSGGANLTWSTHIAWPNHIAPTLGAVSGGTDILKLICADGATWFGYAAAANVVYVAATYDSAVLADNPVAYWKLNETSGTVATDSGPNAISTAYVGSPSLAQSPIAAGLGTSVMFNASSAYVQSAHHSSVDFNSGSFSIEGWLYSTSPTFATVGQNWLSKAFNSGYRSRFDGPVLGVVINGSAFAIDDLSFPLAVNTPYHVVITVQPGVGTNFYINGALIFTNTGAPNPADTSQGVVIGGDGPTSSFAEPFIGYISNVALYASALSPTRVAAHYSAGAA